MESRTCMMPVNWVTTELRLSSIEYFNMAHVHICEARSCYEMSSMEILICTIHIDIIVTPISIVVWRSRIGLLAFRPKFLNNSNRAFRTRSCSETIPVREFEHIDMFLSSFLRKNERFVIKGRHLLVDRSLYQQ